MQICVLGRWVLPSPHLHHVGVALDLAAGGAGGTFQESGSEGLRFPERRE